jgi:hypothetical protein
VRLRSKTYLRSLPLASNRIVLVLESSSQWPVTRIRQVLECASPLALWKGFESARGLAHSKTLPRLRRPFPKSCLMHCLTAYSVP